MTLIKEVIESIEEAQIKIQIAQDGLYKILKNYEDDEVKEILKNYSDKGINCILNEALSFLEIALEKNGKIRG